MSASPGERHGDSLSNRDVPSLRELLGDETAAKVAGACRFTGLTFQQRNDRSSAYHMRQVARLFE